MTSIVLGQTASDCLTLEAMGPAVYSLERAVEAVGAIFLALQNAVEALETSVEEVETTVEAVAWLVLPHKVLEEMGLQPFHRI